MIDYCIVVPLLFKRGLLLKEAMLISLIYDESYLSSLVISGSPISRILSVRLFLKIAISDMT